MRTRFSVQRIENTELEDVAKIRLVSEDGQLELSFEILRSLFEFEENKEVDIYLDKTPPEKVDDATVLMQGDVFKVQRKAEGTQVFGSLGGLQLRFIHSKDDEFFQAMDPLVLAIF